MDSFRFTLLRAGLFDLPTVLRGPEAGPLLLMLPPLFEEMNRARRLLADLGRALAERGIGSALPDLPGTGDAPGTPDVGAWRAAVAALVAELSASRPLWLFAMRGGALLSDGAGTNGLYRVAPVSSGAVPLREMMRAQAIADQERSGARIGPSAYEARLARGETVTLTGYDITALAADLGALALPEPAVPLRTSSIEGPPVWRQAEPAPAPAFAAALADDIAGWMQ